MDLPIIIDTREQAPYTFANYRATTKREALPSGDYSILGYGDYVAVERKELGDLLACLSYDRDRFGRELQRLKGYEAAAVVVEATFDAIQAGNYRSRMNPEAATQSLISIMEKYRIPIFFAADRKAGEFFTYHFLRHYANHAAKKYKALYDYAQAQIKREKQIHATIKRYGDKNR